MPSTRQIPAPGRDLLIAPAILESLPGGMAAFGLLQSHGMLKGIPVGVLGALVEKCEWMTLARGDVLLRPGAANHTLYFLLSGGMEVHLDSCESGNSFPVGVGEVIGEMSIIEHKPAAAWVVAAQPSTLLAMPEQVFWNDFLKIPQATGSLLRMLISRVRKTDAVLVKELERKVRYELLQRELQSAAKIQASILPNVKPLFPKHPQVEAHAVMQPAREVGGDFFDALAINDHCLCVAVGDVCGKGLPAALFMVRVITLLRMCVLREQNPAAILPAVNRFLCEANEECMFVTLAVVLLDTRTGKLTYLNGGHNPPFLAVNGEPFKIWNPPTCPLLGFDADGAFSIAELILQPGDGLVLYTDGVSEAENARHEQFNLDRTARALGQSAPEETAVGIVDRLTDAIASFAGGTEQSDDITVLALRYRGEPIMPPAI